MGSSVHLSMSRPCVLQGRENVFLRWHLRKRQGQLSFSVGWLQSSSKAASLLLRSGKGVVPRGWRKQVRADSSLWLASFPHTALPHHALPVPQSLLSPSPPPHPQGQWPSAPFPSFDFLLLSLAQVDRYTNLKCLPQIEKLGKAFQIDRWWEHWQPYSWLPRSFLTLDADSLY